MPAITGVPWRIPVAAEPVASTGRQRVFIVDRSFQYPALFLAPIALIIGAVYLGRLFTADPFPLDTRHLPTVLGQRLSPDEATP